MSVKDAGDYLVTTYDKDDFVIDSEYVKNSFVATPGLINGEVTVLNETCWLETVYLFNYTGESMVP